MLTHSSIETCQTLPAVQAPPAIASPDPRIGALLGNFRVVRKIGEGGMGVVYEAEHHRIGRRVAIKLLHRQFGDDPQVAQRFLNEARTVNIIRHRGLVEIFEYGQLPDGTLYFVMEYLDGQSLRQRLLARRAPFPVPETAGLATQMARALAAAHAKGIIHRDLKPENVMVVADPVTPGLDWVKILDFGIAKVRVGSAPPNSTNRIDVRTRTGSYMGTPLYMAPEQHGEAETADGKADVFALGVMLYEMLAGRLPYKTNALSLYGTTPESLDTVNPLVPLRLAVLVQRMLSAVAANRPPMEEVAQELTIFLPAPRTMYPRWLWWMAGVAVLLATALAAWVLRPRLQTQAEVKQHARAVLAASVRDADPDIRVMAVRALGQSRDFEQRSLIEPLIIDPKQSPPVVEEAAKALGRVGAIDAQPALLALLSRHRDGGVQIAAAAALARLGHPRGIAELKRLVENQDGDLLSGAYRMQAALLLLERGDSTGVALLWTSIERGLLTEKLRVQALGRLALSGDERAQRLLSEELKAEMHLSGEARTYAAFSLARLGEESGWALLRRTAAASGTDQLLALRLLASLGESVAPIQLLQLAKARNEPDANRELALASLADSGRDDSLRALGALLDERGASVRLRIAAAGAILQIAAGERTQVAEQSLSWAQAALASDNVPTRELAVAVLGDMNSEPLLEKTIAPLGRALQDRDRGVRKSAAHALGRKITRSAVQVLVGAVDDSDPEVRVASMQSAGKVVSSLKRHGDRDADSSLQVRLRNQATSASELDRIVASGTLLQLGDARQSATLRSGLASQDASVRRLAVEMIEPDRDAFIHALEDSDAMVRFAAARRLAGPGPAPPEALAILREAALRVDSDGLAAYGLLRQLGESVPPPPELSSLLISGDLPTRFAIIQMIPELPPPLDAALHLLQIGLLDPAAVVRRRAAEVAANFYRRTGQIQFLQMVRSLRNDADVIVRAQAAILAAELAAVKPPVSASQTTVSPERTAPVPAAQDSPTLAASSAPTERTRGALLLDGEALVRVRVDNGPAQTLTPKPVPLAPGRHRISYLGGTKDVQVRSGQTLKVRIPVTAVEQLLHDCEESINRKEYARAQEQLGQARRLLSGRADAPLQAELAYRQARLYEARGQLREALSEYNRCLSVSAADRRSELNAGLQEALARLSTRAGRIQIFTAVRGVCRMTQEVLLLPGEQVISVGRDQTRTVFAQVGSTNKVMACQ